MTVCLACYGTLLSIVPILFHHITLSHYIIITCTFFFSKRWCTHACAYRKQKLRPLQMISRESSAYTSQCEILANHDPPLSCCTTCKSAGSTLQVPVDPQLCTDSFLHSQGVPSVPHITQLLPELGLVLLTFCSAEVCSQTCQAAHHLI